MKTIKVFIAASKELRMERNEFVDMILQLNRSLKSRGIELETIKWSPDEDLTPEEQQAQYDSELHQSELCMVLYWNEFGTYSQQHFETAYELLKSEKNPRKLYIYFKEPDSEAVQEMKDFKAQFATKYGHFYCRFENVDTMRLNFLLQFEQYQDRSLGQDPLVKVKHTQVEVNGERWMDLKDIPFAGKNRDYIRMQEDLVGLQEDIIELEEDLAAGPNERKESRLLEKRKLREKLNKEIEEMGKSMLDTARQIVSLSYVASSKRLTRAIELFEEGNNKGADAVLNFDEINSDMALNAQRFDLASELKESAKEALNSNIEECKLKVNTLKTEKSEGWFHECEKIYDVAIGYARGRIDDKDFANLLYIEAYFLSDNCAYQKSIERYSEALTVCIKMSVNNPLSDRQDIVLIKAQMGVVYAHQHLDDFADEELKCALHFYRKKADVDPLYYRKNVAWILGNLAILHTENYIQAKNEFDEALSIYRELAKTDPGTHLGDEAWILSSYGMLQAKNRYFSQAKKKFTKALEIFSELAKSKPDDYLGDVAWVHGLLGGVNKDMGYFDRAANEYDKALEIFVKLRRISPEKYQPWVEWAVDNLIIIADM